MHLKFDVDYIIKMHFLDITIFPQAFLTSVLNESLNPLWFVILTLIRLSPFDLDISFYFSSTETLQMVNVKRNECRLTHNEFIESCY